MPTTRQSVVIRRFPCAFAGAADWTDERIRRADRLSVATDRMDGRLAGLLGTSRVNAPGAEPGCEIITLDFLHVLGGERPAVIARLIAHALLDHCGLGPCPTIVAARVETAALEAALTGFAHALAGTLIHPLPDTPVVDLSRARLTRTIVTAAFPGARVDLSSNRVCGGRISHGRVSDGDATDSALRKRHPSLGAMDQVLMLLDLRGAVEADIIEHCRRIYRRH